MIANYSFCYHSLSIYWNGNINTSYTQYWIEQRELFTETIKNINTIGSINFLMKPSSNICME